MKRKQILVLVIVCLVLGSLVYFQFRTWRNFDWQKFKDGTEGVNYWRLLLGCAFIYLADALRGVRWKIFLRPTRPNISWKSLISPQFVGFAGLGLLGRPGELIRPYLLARRAKATFSSQLAIWAVERVFDIAGVTIILLFVIFMVPSLKNIEHYEVFRTAGYALVGIIVLLTVIMTSLSFYGPRIALRLRKLFTTASPQFAENLEKKVTSFSEGLNTLHNFTSFVQISLLTMVIWLLVALSYREVTHAYPLDSGLPGLDLPEVVLLMGASVAGGVIQLPVIGGGSQLATIAVLDRVFDVGPELAVSAGILFWLVTFMSVVPVGLILARHEHVSLRKLSEESETVAEVESEQTPIKPLGP